MTCKHTNFEIRGNELVGYVTCPTCNDTILLYVAAQNLVKELQDLRDELKALVSK